MTRFPLALAMMGGALASADAYAKKSALEPYMWGVGGNIGTVIVPGQYPLTFLDAIDNYDFLKDGPRAGDEDSDEPKRDLDRDGNPRYTSLERVKTDVRLGLEGFYGINKDHRIGAGAGLATGRGYNDVWFTFNYDHVLVSENPFNVLAGVQAGFGSMTFKGVNEEIQGFENEVLKVPYFPVRGLLRAQLRNKTQMYGLSLFAQTSIPSNTFYTDLDGNEQDIGSPFALAFYLAAGLQFDIQFGDFTAPKKNNNNNKGGKNKKNKGGGGGGGSSGGGGGVKKPTK